MTNGTDFKDVDLHSEGNSRVYRPRNIGYYDSKYWYIAVSGSNTVVQYTTDFTTHTDAYTIAAITNPHDCILRIFEDQIYAVVGTKMGASMTIYIAYSINGGSTWTLKTVDAGVSADWRYGLPVDVLIDAKGYLLLDYDKDSDATWHSAIACIEDLDAAHPLVATDTHTRHNLSYYFMEGGCYLYASDTIKYAIMSSTGDVYVVTYDVAAGTFTDAIDTFLIEVGSTFGQYFEFENGSKLSVTERYIYYKDKISATWSLIDKALSTLQMGIVWDYDIDGHYTITHAILGLTVYKIYSSGAFFTYQTMAATHYLGSGMKNYACSTNTTNAVIYTLTYKVISMENGDWAIPHVLSGGSGQCRLNTQLAEHQILEFYTSTGTLQALAKVDVDNDRSGLNALYDCKLVSPIEEDLDAIVYINCVATHPDVFMKTVIDTYCSMISYTATSITAVAIDVSVNFYGKKVRDVFVFFNGYGGNLSNLRRDGTFYFDTFAASGITIAGKLMSAPDLERITFTTVNLQLFGGWDSTTSTRFESIKVNSPNARWVTMWFPEITNQTDLDTKRDQLSTLKNLTVQRATFDVLDQYPENGQTFTLTVTKPTINATYYVYSHSINLLNGVVSYTTANAFYSQTEEPDRISNIEQYIDNTNKSVDSKLAIASPTLTGTPAAPTAAEGTATTQLATTEFVQKQFKANWFQTLKVESAYEVFSGSGYKQHELLHSTTRRCHFKATVDNIPTDRNIYINFSFFWYPTHAADGNETLKLSLDYLAQGELFDGTFPISAQNITFPAGAAFAQCNAVYTIGTNVIANGDCVYGYVDVNNAALDNDDIFIVEAYLYA
jgi:hypothetical protein